MYEIVKNSEPLREITYCIAKTGEYRFDKFYSVPRMIQGTNSFIELKWLLILIHAADSDGLLTEDAFDEALRAADIRNYFPTLDSWLRWPWHGEYEA